MIDFVSLIITFTYERVLKLKSRRLKMKKLLTALLSICMVACLGLALTGCGENHTHTFGEWIPEKPVTCTAYGIKGHYHCSECNKDFDIDLNEINDLIIESSGHDYGTWITEQSATCSSDGTKGHYHCSKCNKDFDADKNELTDLFIQGGHDYQSGTCTVCHDQTFLTFKQINDGTAYSVARGGFSGTELVIPSRYNGKPVTTIVDNAFNGYSKITSVTIPNSITSIGNSAFYNCTNLTNISIGNGVTSIGTTFVGKCNKLEYNEYDNASYLGNGTNPYLVLVKASANDITSCNVNENCKIIYGSAFTQCGKLTQVTIPNGVTSIGSSAFNACNNLTSITIPNSVTSIGSFAFYQCSKLTQVTIPDSVTSIDEGIFWYCYKLESIVIGSGITSIESYTCEETILNKVYYKGTENDWQTLKSNIKSNNNKLLDSTVYYYSETEPTESGNYWHYVDEEIVAWEAAN